MGRPVSVECNTNGCKERDSGTWEDKKIWKTWEDKKSTTYNDREHGSIPDTKNIGRAIVL